jgi:hypothetical protein
METSAPMNDMLPPARGAASDDLLPHAIAYLLLRLCPLPQM